MNRLSLAKRTQILTLLTEGNSLRSITRITGVALNTVSKLLVETGAKCQSYHSRYVSDLRHVARVQIDEIWSFYGTKPKVHRTGHAATEIWTFVAICPDTKLIVSWLSGKRSAKNTQAFINDMLWRLPGHVQVSSDGYYGYEVALRKAKNIDYGKVLKEYANPEFKTGRSSYCKDISHVAVRGDPDMGKISTSIIERQNLTMRRSISRMARATNAHSKKFENHCHAIALHFMHYNFCRIHGSLRVTPAMESGLTDRVWEVGELLCL